MAQYRKNHIGESATVMKSVVYIRAQLRGMEWAGNICRIGGSRRQRKRYILVDQ